MMKIRTAEPADLQRIVEIYNQAVPGRISTGDTEPLDPETQRDWFLGYLSGRNPIFVAEAPDGSVEGYNALSLYRGGRPAFRHTLETSYYVHEQHRRQGIASGLMEYVLARCPELGIKTLVAYVMEHNRASIALLERFGFQRWGLLPRAADFDGKEYDHTLHGKRLGQTAPATP